MKKLTMYAGLVALALAAGAAQADQNGRQGQHGRQGQNSYQSQNQNNSQRQNDSRSSKKTVSVPEPATFALFATGVAALVWARRRKRDQ